MAGNRIARAILSRLSQGPATAAQLRHDIGSELSASRRRKLFYAIRALQDDGLIWGEGHAYTITAAGVDRLQDLEAEGAPNVRIFVQAEAG